MIDILEFFNKSKDAQLHMLSATKSDRGVRDIFLKTTHFSVASEALERLSPKDRVLVIKSLVDGCLIIAPTFSFINSATKSDDANILCLWNNYKKLTSVEASIPNGLNLPDFNFFGSQCEKQKT